jgi:hypothetical protein
LLSNLHQSHFFYKLLCLFREMQDAMYIWVVGLRHPLFSMAASSG